MTVNKNLADHCSLGTCGVAYALHTCRRHCGLPFACLRRSSHFSLARQYSQYAIALQEPCSRLHENK